MAKDPVPVPVPDEMDAAHKLTPSKTLRKVLDVHAGQIMLQKTKEISQLLWHNEGATEAEVNISNARAFELYESLEPADGAEGMLAVQMVGTHNAALECLRRATLPNLMGWMAPAPTDVAMRHTAVVKVCKREEPPHASYNHRRRSGQEHFSGSRDH
jgi:hypothetical protein